MAVSMQIDGGASALGKRGRKTNRVLFPKKKAKQGVPAVRGMRMMKPEIKSVDTTLSGLSFDSTASRILALNLTSQGNAEQNRNGRKISLKSVLIRWAITVANDPTTAAKDYLRLLLVYDRQPNAALPATADILQDTDKAGTNSTSAFSGLNLSNADRFKVLRDSSWDIPFAFDSIGGGGGNVSTQTPQVLGDISRPSSGKWFVKLNGLETHYNSTNGGTIADVTTGSLLLVTLGLNSSTNYNFALDGQARVRFTDV